MKRSRSLYFHRDTNEGKIQQLEALHVEYRRYLQTCIDHVLQVGEDVMSINTPIRRLSMDVKIGFCTSNAWISRAIRWVTHGTVSHTFLLIQGAPAPFGDIILEAVWCGWRLSTLQHLEAGATVEALVDVPPSPQVDAALETVTRWLDTPYAYLGVLGMLWVYLGRWLGQHWRNPVKSPHTMFCSEANTYFLELAGWPASIKGTDPASESPEALLETLEAVPGVITTP